MPASVVSTDVTAARESPMVRVWKRTLTAMDKLRNLSTAELRERCEDAGIELLPASAKFTRHELATILVQDSHEKLPPRHRPSVTAICSTVSVSHKHKFEAEAEEVEDEEEHTTDQANAEDGIEITQQDDALAAC